jgi:hypothetical protein
VRHHKQQRRARGAAARSSFELFEQELTGRRPHKSRQRADHKTLQLCRQVERALSLALAGECDDDVVRELLVDGVEPAGSASQLLVRLRVPATIATTDAFARVEAHSTTLRCLVAQSICRKRVPTLMFICLPEARSEGGGHE